MLQRHFARDRFVMLGLLLLGLAMVVAGVLSGRSGFDYVLMEDARAAATAWARDAEARRTGGAQREDGGPVSRTWLDDAVSRNAQEDVLASFVARVSGAALLDDTHAPVLASGRVTPERIARLSAEPEFANAVDASLRDGDARVVRVADPDTAGQPAVTRFAVTPVREGETVAHVYVVETDQAAAERMTEAVLSAASAATSLLIVMGFVVPAAIAARRIRERWRAEDEMRFLALHDPLTALPNRVQLKDRLRTAVARCERHGRSMAVLCLDLDRFKDINDTLGHATGDALLHEVADRLQRCVREIDVVARLGGDEFAIVAEDLDAPEDATRLARRVGDALAAPYRVDGHEFVTSVSIGIALGPLAEDAVETLLKRADLALYRAKRDGRSTFRFFEPEMDAALQERRRLEQDLRAALSKGELEIRYQPQYEFAGGQVTGYEALLRWQHPRRGEVPFSQFLPIAEETGLIAIIGEWVLTTACTYAATWPQHISLAVNLSPAQFKAQDIVAAVERVLKTTGFPPRRLELEITERVLLHNTDTVIAALKRLDALGVRIAMDDFGTGYSSLSYLTRCPVRKIKIDGSFIDTLGDEPDKTAIVSSIVGLGHSLNVTITAEGVDTPDQADILRAWGCDQVQGVLYGQPEPRIGVTAVARPAADGGGSACAETSPENSRQVA